MSNSIDRQLFGQVDAVLEQGLNHRLKRQSVHTSNIANSATPGFRAVEYQFEEQLQAAIGRSDQLPMKATNPKHIVRPGVSLDGVLRPDVHVKPTESIGNDGNTVDVDAEMSEMASNQIMYKATIESMNRRLGMLRYGITGGNR